MFGSSLPPVVCRRAHVLLTLFVFGSVTYSDAKHILRCVFVLFVFVYAASFSDLSIFISPSVFANVCVTPINYHNIIFRSHFYNI
jgi:hypothetical protein